MMNSERSSSGKKPTPTVRDRRDDSRQHDEHRDARERRARSSARAAAASCVSANTSTAMPTKATSKPVSPPLNSVNDAKNVPIASATIAARWSSAHAITPR